MAVTIVRMQSYQQTNNQNAVQFYVNFGEAVSNVSSGDFALLGTGSATIGNPSALPGDGPGVWIVPITITADGTFGLQLKDTTDVRTNAGDLPVAGVSMPQDQFWTIERVPPTITSVSVPANGVYHAGEKLDFTLHFDEEVKTSGNLARLSLTLDTGGTVDAYITATTATSLTFSYTVQSSDLDANGITIGALSTFGGVTDLAGNAPDLTLNNVGSTAAVLVDGRPFVRSIERVGAATTNATSASYTVTFDQSVTGVDATDFVLIPTGTADGLINSVTGSGAVYTVTVESVSGDGTLRLDLKSSGTGIAASSGGAIASGYTGGQTYTLDHTAPTVTSVSVPANSTYNIGGALTFTVNFGESVTVDTTNGTPTLAVTLDTGGTRQATYVSGSGSTALVFRYTVQSGDADTSGVTLGGSIALNSGAIRDTAGNGAALSLNSVGNLSGVRVDTIAPTNKTVSAAFSSDTGPSSTDLITRTAAQTVSGSLSTPLASDEHVEVSLNNGGAWVTATAAAGTSGWSLGGVTLTGSNTLQVRVVDAAGNAGEAFSRAYALDTTAPAATPHSMSLSADSGVSASDFITNVAAQTLSGSLSGLLAAGEFVEISLDGGGSWTTATTTGTSWTASLTLASSDTLVARVVDLAGNEGTPTFMAYALDTSAPTTTGAAVAFSSDTGASGTDRVTRTQSQTVSGVLTANVAAGESVEVSLDDGDTWSVATASVGSNAWSLGGVQLTQSDTLKVRVSDAAGNKGAALDAAYVFDNVAPSVTVGSSQASLRTGETATITFTFNEDPHGFSAADVSVTGGSLSGFAVTANPRVYTAVFTASANVSSVSVAAGGYTDLAGNDGGSGSVGMAWTPPASEPQPQQPSLTAPQIRDIFTTVGGFTLNSTKALASNIVLADGSSVPNPAFEAAIRLASLIARFESGSITRDALIDGVAELSAPTSGVALQAYQFFTGRTPTMSGMAWLIDSPSNANDLTDPYYARFNEVNRFINFAVNLGVQGEGRAVFEAKFGALDFAASVRLAYDMVIGLDNARAAGINVDAALTWIAGQEGYFDAFAGSDLGGKAAMVGYIMQAGYQAKVGRYYEASYDFIASGFDGAPAYHVDLVGGQHLGG